MERTPKLAVTGLNAAYGRAHILHDVALAVGVGEVVALVGRNGAGKSTTLRSILGLIPNCDGDIVFDGAAVSQLPAYARAQRGLGYVPEDRRIFSDLTVDENLEIGRQGRRQGAPHWTHERLFEIFPNLGELRGRFGGRMSGGEQQMLAIARTLMGNPSLVLLDEPSEGLAPKIVEQMIEAILAMKRGRIQHSPRRAKSSLRAAGRRSRLRHREGTRPLFRNDGRVRCASGYPRRLSGDLRASSEDRCARHAGQGSQ